VGVKRKECPKPMVGISLFDANRQYDYQICDWNFTKILAKIGLSKLIRGNITTYGGSLCIRPTAPDLIKTEKSLLILQHWLFMNNEETGWGNSGDRENLLPH
jgi:hypothetical protein